MTHTLWKTNVEEHTVVEQLKQESSACLHKVCFTNRTSHTKKYEVGRVIIIPMVLLSQEICKGIGNNWTTTKNEQCSVNTDSRFNTSAKSINHGKPAFSHNALNGLCPPGL